VAKPSPGDMKDVEEAARLEDPNTKSIAQTLVVQVTTATADSTATAATRSMLGLTQNVTRLPTQPVDPFMHDSDPSNVKDLFNVWDQCHRQA
jgi:hypothetical protein